MINGKLYPHQQTGVDLALEAGKYALYFDTGTGKTITALEFIDRVTCGNSLRFLVITPKSVIESWLKDARKHFPHLQIGTLARYKKADYVKKMVPGKEFKNTAQRRDYMQKNFDIIVVNPEQVIPRGKLKKGNVDYKLFDGSIVDESAMLRSGKTAITKILIKMSDLINYVMLLSGTPAPNDSFEFWGQMRCLNPELLGKSEYRFKQKYGYQDKFNQWHLRSGAKKEIMDLVKTRAIFVDKRDVLKDLPPLTEIVRYTVESKKNKDQRYEIKDLIGGEGFNIGQLAKYRELASGFIYKQDVATGERTGEVIIYNDDKLNTLKELLDQIGDHKVIIWVQFDADIDRILNITGRYQTAIATGRTKDLVKELSWFKGEFKTPCKYVIGHPLSIGEGVDGLQEVCSICVFYNINYSYDRYYQALSRLERNGQLNPMTVFIIITLDSIDVDMWGAIQKKQKFQDYVRDKLK